VNFNQVRDEIYRDLGKRIRLAMADYFEKLQESATIDNYLAAPAIRRKKKKPLSALPTFHVSPSAGGETTAR